MSKNYNQFTTKRRIALTALFLCINIPLFGQNTQLTDIVKKEFDTLILYAKQPNLNLEFDYRSNISSEAKPQGGIIVFNVVQLQQIVNSIGVKYQTDLIRLIIAHELGHQLQFVHNLPSDGVLSECQADIFAGFLMLQYMGKESIEWSLKVNATNNSDLLTLNELTVRKIEESKEKMYAALNAIFNAGQDYAIKSDHPSSEQRRLAVRDGIAYGNLWLFSEILNNPDNPYPKFIEGQEKIYKELLNYLPQDNILTWSKRHAIKILHIPIENCKYIAVYTDWKWDTTSANPYLYYEQSVTNIGNKTISLSFYNQIYTVLKSDPNNSLYWDLRATKSHFVTLHQNETKDIEDSIKWVASDEIMPRFVGFGDQGSLYDCSSLTDYEKPTQENSKHFFSAIKVPEYILLDIIISSRSDFSRLISGVGRINARGDLDDIYFSSKIPIASANETSIHYDKEHDSYDFQVDYYYGDSGMEAKTIVQDVISNIEKTGNKVKESGSDNQGNIWTIYNKNMEILGEIYFTQLTKSKYSVYLEISGIIKLNKK